MTGTQRAVCALVGTLCTVGLAAPGHAGAEAVVHTLRPGDTVWRVASLHDVETSAVERLNHLDDVRALPVGLRLVLPPRGDAADPAGDVRTALAESLWALRRARFEEALEIADRGRRAREALPPGTGSAALGAQLELASAIAELAFGRREAALAHLVAALRLDPALALERSTTSPKVLVLLAEAREALQREGPTP